MCPPLTNDTDTWVYRGDDHTLFRPVALGSASAPISAVLNSVWAQSWFDKIHTAAEPRLEAAAI